MKKEKIKITRIKSFSACINLGLLSGYSNNRINKLEVYQAIQEFQDTLIETERLYLTAAITECDIVLSGQVEPHLKVNFINYPKFPQEEEELKKHIEELAKVLMHQFKQNRVVIEYVDETLMLEKSAIIDPRIQK